MTNLFKDFLMTIVIHQSGQQDHNHIRHSADRPYLNTGRKSTQILRYKKVADTCTHCMILTNKFRLQKGTNIVGNTYDSAGKDDVDIENEIDTVEVILAKAKSHVQMYQIQSNWAIKVVSIARLDITYHLPYLFSRKVLTIYTGQNLFLPNFEGKHPGDTYCMSPLTVLLFGVVNNSTENGQDRMNAYIWREFEGDRGQNNITLCLLMDLKNRGWLSTSKYGELTYIADNCGGQNKKCVL